MSLAALDHALCDDVLVRRAETDRRLRSVSLLLHERVPTDVPPETTGATWSRPGARRSLDPPSGVDSRESGRFPDARPREWAAGSWISDSGQERCAGRTGT
jgi:hypothetical protein